MLSNTSISYLLNNTYVLLNFIYYCYFLCATLNHEDAMGIMVRMVRQEMMIKRCTSVNVPIFHHIYEAPLPVLMGPDRDIMGNQPFLIFWGQRILRICCSLQV